MAARDARQLREDAAAAAAAGKYKRALECYNELERQEPSDAQWPKRAAEMLRRLGKLKESIAAYDRAVDRYTQGGFLVQAIAVCKLILQLDPTHPQTQLRLSAINEQQGNASTRIGTLVEGNTSLHDNPMVQALRTRPPPLGEPSSSPPQIPLPRFTNPTQVPRYKTPSEPPVKPRTKTPERAPFAAGTGAASAMPDDDGFAVPRTRTGSQITVVRRTKSATPPIKLAPGQAIDQVLLAEALPGAHQHRDDGSQPGILVIPLDETLDTLEAEADASPTTVGEPSAWGDSSDLAIEAMPLVEVTTQTLAHEIDAADLEEEDQLDLEDIEEVPLPEPRLLGAPARRALSQTPLFAGLPMDTMDALITQLQLISLTVGEVVFREGDPGDALFIVSEGEISLSSEGPPRVEMSRIGPGAFFGEVSLVTEGPRSATAAAIAPSELIKIDRRAISSVIGEHPDVLRVVLRFVRDRLVERLVRTSPLFRPFDDGERRALADRFRFLEIDRGSTILTHGQRADGLYIVLAGRFEVQRDGGSRIALGPGDLIGETSLLTGEKVSSPVVAASKALALCLPAAEFRELIMTHPHVLEYVGEQVEARRKVRMI
jgi:CRP-like cAMP-binding protein